MSTGRATRDVRANVSSRPVGNVRSFDTRVSSTQGRLPAHRTLDHRYARPAHNRVHTSRYARHSLPRHNHYYGHYSHWYVHPWYRHHHSTTVVVGFAFPVHAWYYWWTPPARNGWVWAPGYWYFGCWNPGYWSPAYNPPVGYLYVPGWWEAESVYVEGHYRVEERDGWEWADGYYLEDGTYIRGYWIPAGDGPDGYTWEPGFYDGEQWNDGFWRPEQRQDFAWLEGWFDEDAIFHNGYWTPLKANEGYTWIPGWFDGNEWAEGYWVDNKEVEEEDVEAWQPEEGFDAGWDEEAAAEASGEGKPTFGEAIPLAMPVDIP